MQASLGKNTGVATLQSPKVFIDYPTCFQFQYNITNQKAQLHLLITTPLDDNFQTVQTWGFENQTDMTGWSQVNIPLYNGVTQIQFVAEKIGFSTDLEYITINETLLINGSCPATGQ